MHPRELRISARLQEVQQHAAIVTQRTSGFLPPCEGEWKYSHGGGHNGKGPFPLEVHKTFEFLDPFLPCQCKTHATYQSFCLLLGYSPPLWTSYVNDSNGGCVFVTAPPKKHKQAQLPSNSRGDERKKKRIWLLSCQKSPRAFLPLLLSWVSNNSGFLQHVFHN